MNDTQNVVYFMSTADYIKIGISKNLKSRIKQVQTGCPIQLRRVEYINVEDRETALSIEKMLHKEFVDLHTFGEWFYLVKDCNIGARRKTILKKFNITKIEILFDLKKDFYNERSNVIYEEINKIHFSDLPYNEKISKLNKIQNSIENNMEKELFLSYSKNTLVDMCKRYINKNINSLRVTSLRVENQAKFEIKQELREKDLILIDIENKKSSLSYDLKKIKDELIVQENEKIKNIENKLKKAKNRISDNFISDEKKVQKVINKYSFLFKKEDV